jgi:hypothetical protein
VKKLIVAAILWPSLAVSAELIHNFQSPAFIPGNGFSQHVLTIHQLEEAKKKEIKAEEVAAINKAETAAKSTNLAKFLVNVEARIYAQLSKQLADQLFAETSGNTGTMEFQGTRITWTKDTTLGQVTLVIVAPTGTTEIVVPIASFAF